MLPKETCAKLFSNYSQCAAHTAHVTLLPPFNLILSNSQ